MEKTAATKRVRHRIVNMLLVAYGVVSFGVGAYAAFSANYPLWPRFVALSGVLVGVLFVAGAFAFSMERKLRLALLAVSVTVSLYALEIGLRVFLPRVDLKEFRDQLQAARAVQAEACNVQFDPRILIEVILDLRREGTQAIPSGSFSTYLHGDSIAFAIDEDHHAGEVHSIIQIEGQEVLPLGHPSRVTAVGHQNENGQWSVFETDERGFRNPPGIWSKSNLDVVGIGDSFVEGLEVRDEESLMGVIRSRFPNTVNLGLAGSGPLTALAAVREFAAPLKPKVVLWCFYEANDLLDLEHRTKCPLLMRYLDGEFRQDLAIRQQAIDQEIKKYLEHDLVRAQQLDRRYYRSPTSKRIKTLGSICNLLRARQALGLVPNTDKIFKSSLVFSVREPTGSRWATGGTQVSEAAFETFEAILDQIKSEVEAWGGNLFFVYLPSWNRVADPEFRLRVSEKGGETDPLDYRPRVLALVKQHDIQSIDLTVEFALHADPISLFPHGLPGHYNPKGYHYAATKILERIADEESSPLFVDAE